MMRLFFLIILLSLSSKANSYVYSIYKNQNLDPNKPTHVFIVGYPGQLGDLFLLTAHTKLKRYDRLYPENQKVILLAKGRSSEQSRSIAFLRNQDYKIIYSSSDKITTSSIYRRLKDLKKIASIDAVTHSAAELGIGLEKGGIRMNFKSDDMKKLSSHFTEDAFVVIHGCNSGFILAPSMSEVWGVPVFGSLTSTDFQRLHSNGNWYFNNSGQYPSGGWANNCHEKGGCVRMKPDNRPYKGYWGTYHVGLPFMRPFCAGQVSAERCLKARLNDLKAFPSGPIFSSTTSKEDFRKAAFDYLCPRNNSSDRYIKCAQELRDSEFDNSSVSFPFNGPELDCSKETCSWRMKRERHHRVRVPIFYQVNIPVRGQIIEEYLALLMAFDEYNKELP